MPKPQNDDTATEKDMQVVGHQLGSLASVLVVAAVQFGIPLTPGQQSSILSVIAVAWALFATIYGIRHRIPRRPDDDTNREPTTTPGPSHLPSHGTTTPTTRTTDDQRPANDTDPRQMP